MPRSKNFTDVLLGKKLVFIRQKLKLSRQEFCNKFNEYALEPKGLIIDEKALEELEEGCSTFMFEQAISLKLFTRVNLEDLSQEVPYQTFTEKYKKEIHSHFNHQLGLKLKFVRKKLALSENEFVTLFNRYATNENGEITNQNKIRRIERGETSLSLEQAITWKRFIDIPFEDISPLMSFSVFVNKYAGGFEKASNHTTGDFEKLIEHRVRGIAYQANNNPPYQPKGFSQLHCDATQWLLQIMGISLETIKRENLVERSLQMINTAN